MEPLRSEQGSRTDPGRANSTPAPSWGSLSSRPLPPRWVNSHPGRSVSQGCLPCSDHRSKRSTCAWGHGLSQGMLPSRSRSRMASACSLTSSCDQRSKCISIASRSLSRKSGLICDSNPAGLSVTDITFLPSVEWRTGAPCTTSLLPSVVGGVFSDRVDLLVFERHESFDDEGEGFDALADCVDDFSFEDDERSGAGGAPVDGFDHAVVLELFDDAHLVVDERCELVLVGDRISCKDDHACSSRPWVRYVIFGFMPATDRIRRCERPVEQARRYPTGESSAPASSA